MPPFDPEDLIALAEPIARDTDWHSLLRLIPGIDVFKDSEGYTFCPLEAAKVIAFVHHYLTLIQDSEQGKAFHLQPWQQAIIAALWGFRDSQNRRRYRESYIFIARGNGKSAFASALSLYALLSQEFSGSEQYCVAGDRSQAEKVHAVSRAMVLESKPLFALVEAKRLDVLKHAIVLDDYNTFKVVSSDAKLREGSNASLVIFDEIHIQRTRHLYDVMRKSCRKRAGSLFISITTAGDNLTGIAKELYDYSKRILAGEIKDPKFLPVLFEPDEQDKWDSIEAIRKANPNLNISIQQTEIEDAIKRAKLIPSEEPDVKTKHLNIWCQNSENWLPMDTWDACPNTLPDDSILINTPAFGGWDGGIVGDWSSFALYWPKYQCCKIWVWIPDEDLIEKEQLWACPLRTWAKQGYITLCSGSTRSDSHVIEDLTAILQTYQVKSIGADKSRSAELLSELLARRFPIFEYRQGWVSFTGPCESLESMVVNKQFNHGNNPVLRYAASNCKLFKPANVTSFACRPVKGNSQRKIDPLVALLDAIGMAIREPKKTSIYSSRASGQESTIIKSNSSYANRGKVNA